MRHKRSFVFFMAQLKRAWLNRPQLKRARLNLGQLNLAQIKRFPVDTKAVIAVQLASAILFCRLKFVRTPFAQKIITRARLFGRRVETPLRAMRTIPWKSENMRSSLRPHPRFSPSIRLSTWRYPGANGEDLYALHYSGDDSGKEYTLSFYYYPENGGLLRFKGQKNLEWKRADQP